jgi:hypothetical protein
MTIFVSQKSQIMIKLNQFGVIPIDYNTLVSSLGKYKSPKDKVARMEKDGEIIRLKKGMFVVTQKIHFQTLSRELIAHHMFPVKLLYHFMD